MINFSKREKILVLVVVYLLAIFLSYRYIYQPFAARTGDLRVQRDTLQQQVRVSSTGNKTAQSYDRIKALTKELTAGRKKLPAQANLFELIQTVNDMATSGGVEIVSIKNDESGSTNTGLETDTAKTNSANNTKKDKVAEKNPRSIKFSLTVAGGYYSLLSFLEELEKSERLINVDSVLLSMQQKKSSSQSGQDASNPPPEAPQPKGERNAPEMTDEGTSSPTSLEMDKYDRSLFKMEISMHCYYLPAGDKAEAAAKAKETTPASSKKTGTQ